MSPRLGIRFTPRPDELYLYYPHGDRFTTVGEERERAEHAIARAQEEHARAERERALAEKEHFRAEQAEDRAEQERARADRLAAQLRALGIEPEKE